MGKSGRLGRVARANKISRLGRGGLSGAVRSTLGYTTAAQRALINRGFRGLRGGYYTAEDYAPDQYSAYANPNYSAYGPGGVMAPIQGATLPTSAPGGGLTPAPGGGLTPADANIISSAITAAGKVGTQAIIGTPTLTYNPLTGQYTATGGATLPSTLGLSSALTSYLPLILLAGGAVLLFSVVGRR
jgi:hypothetical protein